MTPTVRLVRRRQGFSSRGDLSGFSPRGDLSGFTSGGDLSGVRGRADIRITALQVLPLGQVHCGLVLGVPEHRSVSEGRGVLNANLMTGWLSRVLYFWSK